MFVLVQLPLVDLRPLYADGLGRVPKPDWSAPPPTDAFIRGFGKIAVRNSKSYGLYGERFFADFDNAVRLRSKFQVRESTWPVGLEAQLLFRRIYYDGRLAGRLEFGFLFPDDQLALLQLQAHGVSVDPRSFARGALALPIDVLSSGSEPQRATIGKCSRELGQAWLAATTQRQFLKMHPPGEVYGQAVALGQPLIHVRVPSGIPVDVGRDRANADQQDGQLFFTSAGPDSARNNVLVQLSDRGSQSEPAAERVVRVLFAHLHALVFAESHFVQVQDDLGIRELAPLRGAVDNMIERLQQFELNTPKSSNDEAFARAMKIWGDRFAGQANELTEGLRAIATEINKPSPLEKGRGWIRSTFELALRTSIEAAVTATIGKSPG